MLLFYLRHGDPIYDPDSLTPLGERQAEALGRRLSQLGLDEIYASSSTRAQLTAKPACEMLHKDMTILDWANEHYAWQQLTLPYKGGLRWVFQHPDYRAILASEKVRALGRRWYEHPAFQGTALGEGIQRVQREADAWLAGFGYRHDLEKNMFYSEGGNSKRVALFAHHGVSTAFFSSVLDIPYPQYAIHFDLQHSGMSVLYFPEEKGWVVPRALQISNDAHLYRAGLPTLYNGEARI